MIRRNGGEILPIRSIHAYEERKQESSKFGRPLILTVRAGIFLIANADECSVIILNTIPLSVTNSFIAVRIARSTAIVSPEKLRIVGWDRLSLF